MRYVYELTVPANTLISAPAESEVRLVAGQIKQIEIAFPPGPAKMVSVVILDVLLQISPANPEGSHSWDDYTEVFSMDYPLEGLAPMLTLKGWSPGTIFEHEITFRFDIVPQEGSERDVLLNALVGSPTIFGKGV